jgi:hypothetical protein
MKYLLRYKNEIVAIAIILLFIFVIKGIVSNYFLRLNKLKNEKEELKDKKLLIARWEKAAKDYKTLGKDFFHKEPLLFKIFVEEKAKDYKLNINYIEPFQEDKGSYLVGTIKIGASCSYETLFNFIKTMERKNIEVDNLIIEGSEPKKDIEMILKTFILKE